MPTSTTDPRLAALESQNRLLRASLLLSTIALVTCGGVTSHYELVTTNTLVIRDTQDEPKITFSSAGNGTITFHATTPMTLDADALARLLAANPMPTPTPTR
jgi:hypothetical protein